jgi:hypothetical protein
MSAKTPNQESMELQLKNLENQNKILRMKMQEQNNSGKFFNDLYSLLENEKDSPGHSPEDTALLSKMKYFLLCIFSSYNISVRFFFFLSSYGTLESNYIKLFENINLYYGIQNL